MKYDPVYMNTVKVLCEEGRLENRMTEVDGVPMFYDGDHPSLEFSLLMDSGILEEFSDKIIKVFDLISIILHSPVFASNI